MPPCQVNCVVRDVEMWAMPFPGTILKECQKIRYEENTYYYVNKGEVFFN